MTWSRAGASDVKIRAMCSSRFVLDVTADDLELATAHLTSAGFTVTDYYEGKRSHRGGAQPGWVRLGAERSLRLFTEAERAQIEHDFSAAMDRATHRTDEWGQTTGSPGRPR